MGPSDFKEMEAAYNTYILGKGEPMEEVSKADVALNDLFDAVSDLADYLNERTSFEQTDRTKVAEMVHELNARYITYAHLVDMAEVAVIE